MDTTPEPSSSTTSRPRRLLCAFAPGWLSGPTEYRGLVATVPGDEVELEAGDRQPAGAC